MSKTPTKKNTFFENYDLYSDANPSDSVRVKYSTIKTLQATIRKIERLYKQDKITHSRAVQIQNVITQRLRVIVDNTGLGKDRFRLAKRYFEFLKNRTKKKQNERKKLIFNINND